MRLLLDTHIWIWSVLAPERLGRRVTRALESDDAGLWLSPISVWEALMLIERGRITIDESSEAWVQAALEAAPLAEASLTHAVALESRRMTIMHGDPADRLLAATANVYELTLVTADERLIAAKACPVLVNH